MAHPRQVLHLIGALHELLGCEEERQRRHRPRPEEAGLELSD